MVVKIVIWLTLYYCIFNIFIILAFKPEKKSTTKRKRSTSIDGDELIRSEIRSKRNIDKRPLIASEIRSKKQNEMYTENKEQKKKSNFFSKRLLVKRKTWYFIETLRKLNEAQINAVKDMGFGNVFHFKIDYIPTYLAFELVKCFDEKECKIKLNNSRSVSITEDDVELVYGFPRGRINYSRDNCKSNASFMRKIAKHCEIKEGGNVSHKTVEDLMLEDSEGGPWFKRLFLLLLESGLIEPSTCGTIKSKIGEIVDDLDNIRNVNWCSYTLSVLKFAKENWSKKKMNAFAGPLPLLMVCFTFHIKDY